MSKGEVLRALVNERLTAAADEIFALVESTIAEYEEELCRCRDELKTRTEVRLAPATFMPKIVLVQGALNTTQPGQPTALVVNPDIKHLKPKSLVPETLGIKEEPQESNFVVKQEEQPPIDPLPEPSSVGVTSKDTSNRPALNPWAQDQTRSITESTVFETREDLSLPLQRKTKPLEETLEKDIIPDPLFLSETEGLTDHCFDNDNDENWRSPFSCAVSQMETEEDLYSLVKTRGRNSTAQGSSIPSQRKSVIKFSSTVIDGGPHTHIQTKDRMKAKHRASAALRSGLPSTTQSATESNVTAAVRDTLEEKMSKKEDNFPVWFQRCPIKYNLQVYHESQTREGPFSQKLFDPHIKTQNVEKTFGCLVSGKHSVESPLNVYTKQRLVGVKPYSCSLCNKKFTFPSHLRMHMRTHTGERPYSCLHCDKSFKLSCTLKRHMMRHTGEKPYCCPICDKKFTVSETLNKHVLIHIGKTRHTCPVCNKSYTEKGNLRTHIRKSHGEQENPVEESQM